MTRVVCVCMGFSSSCIDRQKYNVYCRFELVEYLVNARQFFIAFFWTRKLAEYAWHNSTAVATNSTNMDWFVQEWDWGRRNPSWSVRWEEGYLGALPCLPPGEFRRYTPKKLRFHLLQDGDGKQAKCQASTEYIRQQIREAEGPACPPDGATPPLSSPPTCHPVHADSGGPAAPTSTAPTDNGHGSTDPAAPSTSTAPTDHPLPEDNGNDNVENDWPAPSPQLLNNPTWWQEWWCNDGALCSSSSIGYVLVLAYCSGLLSMKDEGSHGKTLRVVVLWPGLGR